MDKRPTTEETTTNPPTDRDTPDRIGSVTLPQKVSDLRRKLGQKAKQEPKFRFYTLYDRISRMDVLMTAWQVVVQNDGAPGVDGVSCRDIIDGPGAMAFILELKGYFDTIPHDQLLKAVGIRVTDRQVMTLLRMWLTSVVVETDERGRTQWTRPRQGTPQGGVISPLLANIYLHWFEVLFHKPGGPGTWANARIVRYADDFVILARYQGTQLREWIEKTLEGRFRLTINREKTRVVRMTEPGATLTFLGFTLRYEWDCFGRLKKYLRQEPSDKAQAKVRESIRQLTGPKRSWQPVAMMIAEVNQTIRGWRTYFLPGHPHRVFYRLDGHLLTRFWRHLHRRSQRKHRIPKDLAFDTYLQRLGLQFFTARKPPVHATR